jgi:hypothetical protein
MEIGATGGRRLAGRGPGGVKIVTTDTTRKIAATCSFIPEAQETARSDAAIELVNAPASGKRQTTHYVKRPIATNVEKPQLHVLPKSRRSKDFGPYCIELVVM